MEDTQQRWVGFQQKKKGGPCESKRRSVKVICGESKPMWGGLLTKEGNLSWNQLKFWLSTVRPNIQLLNNQKNLLIEGALNSQTDNNKAKMFIFGKMGSLDQRKDRMESEK